MRKLNSCLSVVLGLTLVGLAGCDTRGPEETPAPQAEESVYNMEARKAEVGVGKQGAKLRADDSLATKLVGGAAARTLFDVKERAVFDIQLPQALSLYKAQDSFGKGPQTHEEYMRVIVRANNIPLPKLPEGMHYTYKPDIEELWVEPDAPAGDASAPADGQANP